MTIVDDEPVVPEKQGPSLIVQIAVLTVMTAAAVGIGWGSGIYLNSSLPPPVDEQGAATAKASETVLAEAAPALGVVYLDPITTNLAGPVEMWVRLEMALVFEGEPDPMVALEIQQDTLAYLRTIRSHQVQGASGFQHLKSDLEERAIMRSEGKVTGILLQTLLFE